jgi:hypothetical protein
MLFIGTKGLKNLFPDIEEFDIIEVIMLQPELDKFIKDNHKLISQIENDVTNIIYLKNGKTYVIYLAKDGNIWEEILEYESKTLNNNTRFPNINVLHSISEAVLSDKRYHKLWRLYKNYYDNHKIIVNNSKMNYKEISQKIINYK